jgi:Cu2+-exporting ATPase
MTEAAIDFAGFVRHDEDGRCRLTLAVEGMHCAGCAMKIEKALNASPGVDARVNVTRRRLTLAWDGENARGNALIDQAGRLGFRFSPVAAASDADRAAERDLLKCMAVAGFASGNLMLFSFALWFSGPHGLGAATRGLFHWYSALVALPAVAYAGRPFFASAWRALARGHTNMDVPISVGVLLTSGMSLFETLRHGTYVYYDSAVMLLLLLLAGRFLDQRARGKARAAAQDLLALSVGVATVVEAGAGRRVPSEDLRPGMTVAVARGERIPADGALLAKAELDTSAITGETAPRRFGSGETALAGMINTGGPLTLRVEKEPADSLLADIARLMEKAEQGNAAYVRIADRVAGWYTPAVHGLALATFLFWWQAAGLGWEPALMRAVTVLIITCPCALGLAVPVVQVLAGQWLFRRGMLIKSADALERLSTVDTVVFDKTGTLTTGEPELLAPESVPAQELAAAAALAARSRHPLCRALAKAWTGAVPTIENVCEQDGGICGDRGAEPIRLGGRAFCGITQASADTARDTWLVFGDRPPRRLLFRETLRPDAAATMTLLRGAGYRVLMLSGDRPEAAAELAAALGIKEFQASLDPRGKLAVLERLAGEGRRVLMVGDGVNDAPALAAATASISPSSAQHIAQNAADIVFQGASLRAVPGALSAARFSQRLVRQNFGMALLYNVVAVPLAIAGLVTPLVAALAMSASSLAVTANALRLGRWHGE